MAAPPSTRSHPDSLVVRLPLRTVAFLLPAAVIALASSSIALRQGSRPDPFRPAGTAEWWRYPMQHNAFARNEAFAGDLNAVYARPGGKRVWAVGDGALLIHSDDGGVTWVQDSLDLSPGGGSSVGSYDSATASSQTTGSAVNADTTVVPAVDTLGLGSMKPEGDVADTASQLGGPQRGSRPTKAGSDGTAKMSVLPMSPLLSLGRAALDGVMRAGASPRAVQQQQPQQQTASRLGSLNDAAALMDSATHMMQRATDSLAVFTTKLRDVQFVDDSVGYAVGDRGVVLRSRDGGLHWRWTGKRLSEEHLLRVLFDAPRAGWVRADSVVYRTMDWGLHWTRVGTAGRVGEPTTERFAQRAFLSHVDAFMADSEAAEGDRLTGAILTSGVAAGGAHLAITAWPSRAVRRVSVSSGPGVRKRRIQPDRPLQATTAGVTSAMFVDSLQGWAATSNGRVFSTSTSGANWSAQSAGGPPLHDVHFADEKRGWAVGAEGTILSTDDGGDTWMVRAGRRDRIRGVSFADSVHGWAVGSGGVILATEDGGETWEPQASPTDSALNAVSFATADTGVAVGTYGLVLRTVDGGGHWTPLQVPNAPSMVQFNAVQMTRGGRGWIAGTQGAVFTTNDGGATWRALSRYADNELRAVVFRDSLTGWIAGAGCDIAFTADGGAHWTAVNWKSYESVETLALSPDGRTVWAAGQDGLILSGHDSVFAQGNNPAMANLTAIRFADAAHGWAAGWDGTLMATADSGRTWKLERTGTRADLLALAAPDGRHLLAAGAGGIFLRGDGAGRWQAAGLPGRWFPAPWYGAIWLLVLALVLLSVPPRRPPTTPDPVEGILVSDRPLQPGDPDPFQLDEVALGISRFLRNERTEPPLTLAVTGPWGSGKSSLMNLIRADLQRRGFRTVAFNAWHHQTEDHLLAAFLENVKQQAVPPWWTYAGIGFRARLLWIRTRRQLPLAMVASVLAAIYLAWLLADRARFGEVMRSLGELVPKSGDLAGKSLGEKIGTVITTLIPGPEQGTAVVGLLGAIGVVGAGLRGAKAFGVKPASLMASVTKAMRLRDLEAQTSFRHRFAAEFDEVTRALSPRDMVIFVDDLDRCRSAHVLQILEAINFLVTSGRCVVIMGMDPERVIRSVGREFGEEVEDSPDARSAAARLVAADAHEPERRAPEPADSGEALRRRRDAFARQYLEKLVNIEVPVPRGDERQQRKLLEPTVLDERRKTVRERMEGGARLARPVLPLAATAALCGLILVYGQGFFRPRATPLPAVASAFAPSAASPGRAAAATSPSTPTTQAAADTSAAVAPQTVAAGRTRAGFRLPRPPRTETRLPLYLGLAVALGVWLLALLKRPDVVVHDTDEFRRALRAWSPYIVAARRPTPRAAKKFLNRVRYYAMRQSAHAPPDTLLARLKALPFRSRRLKVLLRRLGFRAPRARRADDALSEELLVALAAVQECAPDTLDEPGFYTRFDEFLDELGQVSKDAHRRVRELGYVAVITEAQRRQFARISAGIRMS